MVRAAMIVHTRTRLCDFPSTLAVCPSVLGSSELEQMRRQILTATRSIDSMRQNDVRYMVYTCGSYIVSGMVSFLKNLTDDPAADEKFFKDEKGRSIYAFVGFLFPKGTSVTPRLDKKVLWDHFKSYMEPVWERTVLDTQASNFVEMDFSPAGEMAPPKTESVAGLTLSIMGADDASIFSYWLGQALRGKDVSFCSNITDFRVVKEKSFHIMTTTANIVERMKREATSVPPPRPVRSDVIGSTAFDDGKKKTSFRSSSASIGKTSSMGKSRSIWILILGVLFVVIALFFLSR